MITDDTDPQSSVTGLDNAGTDAFAWTVGSISCNVVISDTIVITSSSIPTQADAGDDITGCEGDTLTLIGSIATSGDPIWSRDGVNFGNTNNVRFEPDANNDTVQVALNTAGTYKIYYTVSVGPTNLNSPCTTRDSLTITVNPALTVDAGIDQLSCDGSTTTFTVLGNKPVIGGGQWSLIGAPSGSVTTTSDTIGTVTGLSPGINTLAWQVSDGSCIATDVMTIAVGPPPTAEAGIDLAGCEDDTLQLIGNNAGSYFPAWELGAGVSRFFDASFASDENSQTAGLRLRGPGTYKIYYTIALGTTGDAAACFTRDSLTVTSSGAPTNANISGANTLTSCDTATFTLVGNVPGNGEQGMWTTTGGTMDTVSSANTAIISGLPQGVTTVTYSIANAGGCMTTDVATISIGADAGPDMVACVGDAAFQISGSDPQGGTPLWSTQGSSVVTIVGSAASQNVTVAISGVGATEMLYTVIDGGCVTTDTMTLNTDITCATDISESEASEGAPISIYPNPTEGIFTISLSDDIISAAIISITAIDGRVVFTVSLGAMGNIQKAIDLTGVSRGIYFVRIQKGAESTNAKLIIQ